MILSIIVVGNFLRDGKSNYLEGALCILVYLIIGKSFQRPCVYAQVINDLAAVAAWYYPNPPPGAHNTDQPAGTDTGTGAEHAAAVVERAVNMLLKK